MSISKTFTPKASFDSFRPDQLPKVKELASYAHSTTWKSLFQILNSSIPFGILWYVMYKSLSYSYWLTLLLSIPTAGFLVRLFIMQHDAGHGSFFKSKKANDITGFLIGILTLTPYQYWQKTHAIHHATSGNLDKRGHGDIDTLTVKEYLSLSKWRRFRYRSYRHPITMFIVGPFYQFVIKHRYPFNIPFSWKREWRSVFMTNMVLVAIGLLVWQTIGFKSFLLVQIPVTFLSSSLGSWLFYIQHQYEDTYWERDADWNYFEASVKGSSYYVLPKVFQWFTGNIGLHHIHHYNSRIPNYQLQSCYDDDEKFRQVTRLTFLKSLKSISLALWDEEKKKLISFKTLQLQSA